MIGEIVAAGCSLVFLAVSRHRHKEELARIALEAAPTDEAEESYRRGLADGRKEAFARSAKMLDALGYHGVAESIRVNS